MLPNFLICGAAKAGTTSVYHLLGQHPDIFMPAMKEPHFFVRQSIGRRIHHHVATMEDYAALFAGAGQARWRGEASVFYLYYHAEAIPNIIRTVGRDIPIIAVLRNPIDRAYSAYLYAATYNPQENAAFDAALDLEAARLADPSCSPMLFYRSVGLYNDMVAAYQEAFPRFSVCLFDDLVGEPDKFAQRLFGLLGLAVPTGLDLQVRQNVGGREWVRPQMGGLLKGLAPNILRRAAKRVAPGAYRRLRDALTKGQFMRPATPLGADTRARLAQAFRDDVRRLSDRLGRDLTRWVGGAGASEIGNRPGAPPDDVIL